MRKKKRAEEFVLPDHAIVPENAYFWKTREGIVIIINRGQSIHNLEQAKANIATVLSITDGRPELLLIDITAIKSLSKEAREEYAKAGDSYGVKAVAIVTNSGIGKILGNFFISFDKPVVPTKLFNSDSAAKEWLQDFL